MKNLRKIALGTGILLLVVGVAGAGLTYRDIRTENLLHANMAAIRIPFTDTPASASAGFLPWRDGTYGLYLAVAGGGRAAHVPDDGCTPGTILAALEDYGGTVEVLISDPDDSVVFRREISGADAPMKAIGENGWILIDSMRLRAGGLQWTLGTSVRPEGSPVPPCGLELFLLPPQKFNIGAYMASGVVWLVAFGGCMLTGFVMIVLAGSARR